MFSNATSSAITLIKIAVPGVSPKMKSVSTPDENILSPRDHRINAVVERDVERREQATSNHLLDMDNGGNGGKYGGGKFYGGGGEDGDNDDYFDFNDGEYSSAEGWLRGIFPENYSKVAIQAVLDEWLHTFAGLPPWLRGLVEMRLLSSQQLALFFTIDMRPSMLRKLFRNLPPSFQMELFSRLAADPASIVKMTIDQIVYLTIGLAYEAAHRGNKFIEELDYVFVNLIPAIIAHGWLIWTISASRSFGLIYRSSTHNALANLPNNVFDRGVKHLNFNLATRALCPLFKAIELSVLGALMGICTSILGSSLNARRQTIDPTFRPSLHVPSLCSSAVGSAVTTGFQSNFRYQLISGVDRFAFERSPSIPLYLISTISLRTIGHLVA